MRYAGGLLGGSWLTALAGDLGAGRFDGAWLVQNFEHLNPTNTLWSKQYNLYSKIDTERERYLGFERYWGGYVCLNDVEIQYIVDNLFIGNKLSAAQLVTSDGVRIDLRNIRSPILVFCSYGDNITPPPQALGWLTDLYRDDEDVYAHDQTIIYALHDSIGHLGIFVSGSVGRKEHQEFARNIDFLEAIPSGIYQAELRSKEPDTLNPDLAFGDYVLSIRKRGLNDVRQIVMPDVENDRRFAALARLSEVNLSLYQSFMQPLVRAVVTPQSAQWLQRLHPMRLSYEVVSERNPWMGWIAKQAQRERGVRQPVSPDNPFWSAQEALSQAIEASLDQWRWWRDSIYEQTFNAIYGSPWVQAWAGINARDAKEPRQHPGDSPEHRSILAADADRLRGEITQGALMEAGLRALYYIGSLRGWADERSFNLIRRLRQEHGLDQDAVSLAKFKHAVRRQHMIMRQHEAAAIAALPELLGRAEAAQIEEMIRAIQRLLTVSGPADPAEEQRWQEIKFVFDAAAHRKSGAGGRGPETRAAAAGPKSRDVRKRGPL
jgi:hypothetical protein